MDLVFEEDDGLVIVDYKTNALGSDPKGAAAVLAEHYRPQAEAYAVALSAISDLPVREVVMLFMRGPCEETIPVEADAGSVEAGLAELLSRAAGRGAEAA